MRPWILGGCLLLLGGLLTFQLLAGYAEAKIAARIRRAAETAGMRVEYRRLHVGVWPPFELTGVTIDIPGVATARIDTITATPIFQGPRGFGMLARVQLGNVSVSLPADLDVTLHPTAWEIDPERSVTLKAPVEGLILTTVNSARGRAFDVIATHLSMDALGAFAVEGDASKELGFIDGAAHIEGDPRRDFQGTWRFSAFGGDSGGSLIVIPGEGDAKVQFQSSMKGLDFARILRSLGVDAARAPDALGSLSGTISVGGLLHDPGSLEVIQRIDFKRPERTPAEVLRLRGDFSHEVTTNEGARKVIDVSPSSEDYVAVTEVPALFLRTLLIAEDAAFFSHPGIDLTELPRAIAANMARGGALRGASTITQQLAKNLFLTREKSLQRKLRELSYSFLLESTLGKQRILEIYLNVIEWGPGLYGLRPAARHYFDKEPQALSPREVAFLVSMIPGPVLYQRSIQGGELRSGFETLVNNLLVKMRSVDVISEEAYQAALSEPLAFRGPPPPIDENGKPQAIQ
ncbi:MAG: biosynthetic peptidoglycan transglycosylase [Vicinamibacteria bacterium]